MRFVIVRRTWETKLGVEVQGRWGTFDEILMIEC